MEFPFGETVTVHRRTRSGRDGEGLPIYTTTDVDYPGVTVYPRLSTEVVQGQDLTVIGLVAVFTPAVDVGSLDKMTARGALYDVDGEPAQYRSPFSGETVTQVSLTRAKG